MPLSLIPRVPLSNPELQRILACVQVSSTDGALEILSDAVENLMSSDELRSAQNFFDSALGKKYADLTMWSARATVGLEQGRPMPQFSKEEEREVAQFQKTPAGVKLTTVQLLTGNQAALRFFELSAQMVRDCHPSVDDLLDRSRDAATPP